MPRTISQLAPHVLGPYTKTFLQELANSAAVRMEAMAHSGMTDLYASGVLQACAIPLSLHHGVSSDEIIEEAKARAKQIFQNGEDWRREVHLFGTLIRYNSQ
jgi:hypothetical protein